MTNDEILTVVDELIRKHGYKVRGRVPSGWVLTAPDGRLVHQDSLDGEIEIVTTPKKAQS